jgi:D-glycero-alpha-D-manno-heptose-7-phosphate kinase
VSYTVDAPPGSGLGTSAAQTVLWLALVKTAIANVSDRKEIAEIACQVGRLLGIVGGKQDEYASALGGITYFTFRDTVGVEPLELDRAFAEELRSRLVLVYTGASRLSGSIHERVWTRYRQGQTPVLSALHRLRDLADEMRDALVTHDLDRFGLLLTENWECQKILDPSVSTAAVDAAMNVALANGATGGKACGAGGGGCLVFLARDGESERLRSSLSDAGLRSIDVGFDTYGVHLRKA